MIRTLVSSAANEHSVSFLLASSGLQSILFLIHDLLQFLTSLAIEQNFTCRKCFYSSAVHVDC